MDPAMIIAAIAAGEKLVEYVGGVIARHKAGTDPTADEVAKINAMQQQLDAARAENDASDAKLDQAIG